MGDMTEHIEMYSMPEYDEEEEAEGEKVSDGMTTVQCSTLRLLWEIVDAADDIANGYDDFGEPDPCEHCRPPDPTGWNEARHKLYDLLNDARSVER